MMVPAVAGTTAGTAAGAGVATTVPADGAETTITHAPVWVLYCHSLPALSTKSLPIGVVSGTGELGYVVALDATAPAAGSAKSAEIVAQFS